MTPTTATRTRRALAIVALVAAGSATVATSPGPGPSAFSETTFDISLSPEEPDEVRRITVDVRHGGHKPSGVSVSVGPSDFQEGTHPYIVYLVPEDAREPRPDMYETASEDGYGGAGAALHIDEFCTIDCRRSYVLVARLSEANGPAIATSFTARVSAGYSGSTPDAPTGAANTITVDDADPDRHVAVLTDRVTGRATVGVGIANSAWEGTITVPAAGLARGAPTVGSLTFAINETPSDDDARVGVSIRVNDAYLRGNELYDARLPAGVLRFEWLSECAPGKDCLLPVRIEFEWYPWPDNAGSPPPSGSVGVDWSLDAALDYLDADSPPPGAGLDLTALQ